jgi:hypothetical protein
MLSFQLEATMKSRFTTKLCLVVAVVLVCTDTARADIIVTVPGNVGPWDQALNPAFTYAGRALDNAPAIVIDAASGVGFYPGGTLTLTYESGTVSPAAPYGFWDANGQVGNVTNGLNDFYGRFPAFFMNPLLDVNSVALVGTFANDGVIVGVPFFVGNGPTTLTIPVGANQLLLGINDARFSDNEGELKVRVSSPFNVCSLFDSTKPAKSGSTIPIKLQLCSGTGANLSSPDLAIRATGVIQTSNLISGPAVDAGNANPDYDFRYDASLGGTGGYIFNLQTVGLTTGTYRLNFSVLGQSYGVPFQVK